MSTLLQELAGAGMVLAILAAVGYLTRGWLLRACAWAFLLVAIMMAAYIPYDKTGAAADVALTVTFAALAFGLWCWGHYIYARNAGRWRSIFAYHVLDRAGSLRRGATLVTRHRHHRQTA